MKNRYHALLLILITGIVAWLPAGCSNDKNENSENLEIEGLWRITEDQLFTDVNIETSAFLKSEEGNDENEDYERPFEKIPYSENSDVLYFISFDNLKYTEYTTTRNGEETLKSIQSEGVYSFDTKNNTIIITSDEVDATAEVTITNNQLTLYFQDNPTIKERHAERVSKLPGDNEGSHSDDEETKETDPDEEEITGCAASHQTEAPIGTLMNPELIELSTEYSRILPDSTKNGYEHRFYIQVEEYKHYTISITEVDAQYDEDLYDAYHYLEVSAREEFLTNTVLRKIEINKGSTQGQFTVNPATECLYVSLFSYQEKISFKIKVFEKE